MSVKCLQCGLVNFASDAACKRCGGIISTPPVQPYADPTFQAPERRRKYYRYDTPKKKSGGVLGGLVMIALGIGVTAATYSMAGNRGGGTYIVAWGPVVAGIIAVFRGLASLGGDD